MTLPVDTSRLAPIDQTLGDDLEDTALLRTLAVESREFIESFDWCGKVERGWFGFGVGGIVGVFLFEIQPTMPHIDRVLWVIVGDLPPAYLVVDQSPTPYAALTTYVGLMQDWIDAVRAGNALDECIPVNAPPTPEYADLLQSRLDFLNANILSEDKN